AGARVVVERVVEQAPSVVAAGEGGRRRRRRGEARRAGGGRAVLPWLRDVAIARDRPHEDLRRHVALGPRQVRRLARERDRPAVSGDGGLEAVPVAELTVGGDAHRDRRAERAVADEDVVPRLRVPGGEVLRLAGERDPATVVGDAEEGREDGI